MFDVYFYDGLNGKRVLWTVDHSGPVIPSQIKQVTPSAQVKRVVRECMKRAGGNPVKTKENDHV